MAAHPAADPRRAVATIRLQRLKRIIAAVSAALGLTIWSLIAASVAGTSANQTATATQPPSTLSAPRAPFFQPGSTSLGSGTTHAPVLRSGGS